MKGKLLASISILIGFFVWMIAVPMILINIKEDGIVSTDSIIGYVLFIIGAAPIYFGIQRLTFKIRITKLIHSLEKHQNPYGTKISIISKELKLNDDKTMTLIQELIFFGYVNRIYIDYKEDKIIYLDSVDINGAESNNFTSVKCNSCGGTSSVLKGARYSCEYCGNEGVAPGTREKLLLIQEENFSEAENQSLRENLRLGCLVPLATFPIIMYIIIMVSMITDAESSVWLRLGGFIVAGLPIGIFILIFLYKVYLAILEKYIRPLVAKYLSAIIDTREPDGVEIHSLANRIKANPYKAEKHIKFLIKKGYLVGVSLKGKPARIFYLDDDVNYDRFLSIQCNNCDGEFVATYGKSNRCPYCGNGVTVEK